MLVLVPQTSDRTRASEVHDRLAGTGISLIVALVLLAGCSSPLHDRASPEQELRRSVLDAARREIAEAQRSPGDRVTTREDRLKALDLKPQIIEELNRISGLDSYPAYAGVPGPGVALGPNLLGQPTETVAISLQRVIITAVSNNLDAQFARLAPAVNEAELVAAEAAFDWSFFTNFQYGNVDEQQVNSSQSILGGSGDLFNQRQVFQTSAGLRRRITSGGVLTIQQSLDTAYTTVEGITNTPNPSNQAELTLQLDQPLLRNAGSDVALASVRLAANAQRDGIQQLKATLIRVVTQTETSYWELVRAFGELQIAQRLLERGIEVRNVLKNRRDVDANPSQFANAEAAVQSRQGDLITAENRLRQASDALKRRMNDPTLTVGSEVVLIPADRPVDAPIRFSLLDAITLALGNRPEVQRAVLSIDDSSIRQEVADNARLPMLDLRAQTRLSSLRGGADSAISSEVEGKLVSYLLQLQFEQPIGNRAAEAGYRRRRLERTQAVIVYRDVVQQVVVEIKDALRTIETSYRLIEQRRSSRLAAAEDLRAQVVRERELQGLSPELLDLKLRKQQQLALEESRELEALAGFNAAVAQLFSAIGTALERNRIQFEVPATFNEQEAIKERAGERMQFNTAPQPVPPERQNPVPPEGPTVINGRSP